MSKHGPVILVDDDTDDHQVFVEVLDEMNVSNKVICFETCADALLHLRTSPEQAFMIFCDVNMPAFSGLEFKKHIDMDMELRKKSIPFMFFSTHTQPEVVEEAYTAMTIQGFFKKPSSYDEMKALIRQIFQYWHVCKHPNS